MNPAVASVGAFEAVLRRDRAVAAAGLGVTAALGWIYVAWLALDGDAMAALMPMALSWHAADALLAFVMWAAMMVAMMLPTAAPLVLLLARVLRERETGGIALAAFAGGYLVIWLAFSAAATAAQWGLQQALILTPMAEAASPRVAGLLLLLAGLYQLTPLKRACLRYCRGPLPFLMAHWRPGNAGALRMGLRHGLWCLGCCWAVMALLFVGGVMNLAWVAGLALFVLIEKAAPKGDAAGQAAGGLALAGGTWLLIAG